MYPTLFITIRNHQPELVNMHTLFTIRNHNQLIILFITIVRQVTIVELSVNVHYNNILNIQLKLLYLRIHHLHYIHGRIINYDLQKIKLPITDHYPWRKLIA
mgnify:FL=1